MNRTSLLVAALSLAGILVPTLQQDPKPHAQEKGEKAQEKAAPAGQDQGGAHPSKKTGVHAMFAALAGEYDVALKMTMGDNPPKESKGHAKLTAVVDGRFLQDENEGELMGKMVKGMRLYGWNAEAKVFEGIWTYSESNAIMRLTGKPGQDRKSADFEAIVQETAEKKTIYQVKAERLPEGVLKFTMIHKDGEGKVYATLEETYTKKK